MNDYDHDDDSVAQIEGGCVNHHCIYIIHWDLQIWLLRAFLLYILPHLPSRLLDLRICNEIKRYESNGGLK